MVYKSGQIFLPFCHNPRVWQTDVRTNGQTDRILIARPRLHSMQRGKNADFQSIFARSVSAVTPREKVQLTRIGSLLWAF